MLISLDVKAAVASEDAVSILGTSCRLGEKPASGRRQVATARRRNHALD